LSVFVADLRSSLPINNADITSCTSFNMDRDKQNRGSLMIVCKNADAVAKGIAEWASNKTPQLRYGHPIRIAAEYFFYTRIFDKVVKAFEQPLDQFLKELTNAFGIKCIRKAEKAFVLLEFVFGDRDMEHLIRSGLDFVFYSETFRHPQRGTLFTAEGGKRVARLKTPPNVCVFTDTKNQLVLVFGPRDSPALDAVKAELAVIIASILSTPAAPKDQQRHAGVAARALPDGVTDADCVICFCPIEGEIVSLKVCGHTYCHECFQAIFKLDQVSVPIVCLAENCGQPICWADVTLGSGDSATLTRVKETSVYQFKSRHNLRSCPRPGCNVFVPPGQTSFFCPQCQCQFCMSCSESIEKPVSIHPDKTCQQIRSEADPVAASRRRIVDEILSNRCPRKDCQQAWFDFSGCMALTCSNPSCGANFCALCSALGVNSASTHSHVRMCTLNPGRDLFSSEENFKNILRRKKQRMTIEYIRSLPADLRLQAQLSVERDLHFLGIKITTADIMGPAAPPPNQPAQPAQPVQPAQPIQPIQPVQPVQPVQPIPPNGNPVIALINRIFGVRR